jgi:2-oxoglutarate dehydrogenase E1 component
MLQIPIFHVNGEYPEAVAQVVDLAMDFRRNFRRDVVIDMYCYRLRGHNEGDEPSFTQPLLYRRIHKQPSVRENYLEHLLELRDLSRDEAEQIAADRRTRLEEELTTARSDDYDGSPQAFGGLWEGYTGGREDRQPDVRTGVEADRLADLLARQTELPPGFRPHPKIERAIRRRREMVEGSRPLNWSAAEALAFASLAVEGCRVRLTGQDSERGTFSQRHAVLHDFDKGQEYVPLRHVCDGQAPIEIFNSPLSEAGVLGFEYGYSLDAPDTLVIWEAQFGDFANAAQVIIDQFIASAEDKWRRLSGLVLLLPHGFEGQGPEHSSARLERFLLLAAEDNLQVVVPTTPAQYFHVLRRQALRRWRKPLVVMTPKSLLRHPRAVSTLADLEGRAFERVIPDETDAVPEKVRRLLLCCGKLYYELDETRQQMGRDDVAIIRIEQLYPFPADVLTNALAEYRDGTPSFWVQEEPENMGAWRYLKDAAGERLCGRFPLSGVTRPASASPATGSKRSHKVEQSRVLDRAFGGPAERSS